MRFHAALFALAVHLLACSEESEPSAKGEGTGGSVSGGAGGAGGQGGAQPASLWPLAFGNSWTYTVTLSTPDTLCEAGTRVVTATGPSAFEGKQAFAVSDVCGGADGHYAVEGGEVLEWAQGFWADSLAAPLEEGTSWVTDGTSTYSWKKAPTVTVPAGTFRDCWERTSSDALQFTKVYCPGIGLARATTAGRTAELTEHTVQ